MAKAKKTKAVKAPKEPKAKKAKPSRKAVRENPGMGHNITAIREALKPHTAEYLRMANAMDSDAAGWRSDINNHYEAVANDLGLKKTVVSKELKRIRAKIKEAEKEREMASDERGQTELLRAAWEGTEWAQYAQGDLFPAAEVTKNSGEGVDDGETHPD